MSRKNTRKPERQPDVIDVRHVAIERGPIPPNPEQAAKAEYIETDINEVSGGGFLKLGRAFCRLARFESIQGLTDDQLAALRRYRRAFDTSEVSPVKSALDIGVGGGTGGAEAAIARFQAVAFADIAVQRIEQFIPGHLLQTLRSVALHDLDFKAVAIERYGSRTVERIDTTGRKPRVTTSVEPRSGRHREAIRQQFMEAASALTASMAPPAPLVRQSDASTPAPSPQPAAPADPRFLDEHGRMREWSEIADILRGNIASVGNVDPEPT